jgi:hypothetical protein
MPVDYAGMQDRAARLDELPTRDLERLEREVRRAASRQRLLVQRGPERDRQSQADARYRLVSARNGEVVAGGEGSGYSLALAQVVELLHRRESKA